MKRLLVAFICIILLVGAAGLVVHAAIEQWTNGQNATFVIGKPDFYTGGNGTTATTLMFPSDVAIDLANGKLYVADWSNNRVLRYAYPITGNQPAAELVFGQPNFTVRDSGTSTNTFNSPSGIDLDSTGRLWVTEFDNHRMVWFNNAHAISTNQPDADGVLGQPDFVTAVQDHTQNRMTGPLDVAVASDGTVFVADQGCHRILRFDNAASKSDGANADGVLGQSNFTGFAAATTQSGMSSPRGLALLGGALFVVDTGNARVLRFDSAASLSNGANADGVLGQTTFTSNTKAITQGGLDTPVRVAVDCSGRLYVSDGGDADRVLIYTDVISKPNGGLADNVLGQPDFTSSGPAGGPNRFNLGYTGGGMALDCARGLLFVVDDTFSRVMVFFSNKVYLPLMLRGY